MTDDERDARRYRWWRQNIDLLDEQSIVEVAYDFQVPLHGIDPGVQKQSPADMMDAVADRGIASEQ